MVTVFGRRLGGDDNSNGNGDGDGNGNGDPIAEPEAKVEPEAPAEPEKKLSGAAYKKVETTTITGRRHQMLDDAKTKVFGALLSTLDLAQVNRLHPDLAVDEVGGMVRDIIREYALPLSESEQGTLVTNIVHDTFGLGPIEPLLLDDNITDIMVNAPDTVFIERHGLIEDTEVMFRDRSQLMNVCMRIAMAVGRRIDESSPICDARLADGSRVNIIIPPLALGSPMLTIRKFNKRNFSLHDMVERGTMPASAAKVVEIAVQARANILVAGGTGSGKTTLLNALAQEIGDEERIITVEDTIELRVQQPNVGRLETRPPNIEGVGEVTQRDLVRNCLRMRPDRILVGEARGPEAFDMLQAMNTGHEGSMSTVHANTPRDALTRLEDMVAMSGLTLPPRNVRMQIASALDLIIQVEGMRDGVRRITDITEIIGVTEHDYVTQQLFEFHHQGLDGSGGIVGILKPTRLPPRFLSKAHRISRAEALLDAMGCSAYSDHDEFKREGSMGDSVIRLDKDR